MSPPISLRYSVFGDWMRATVIHLRAVLKSDLPFDVSKKDRYLSCSAVVRGRRNSRWPYFLRNVSAQARSAAPVEQGSRFASALPVTAGGAPPAGAGARP